MIRRRVRLPIPAACAAVLLWTAIAGATGEGPRAVVQRVSDRVIEVLGQHGVPAAEKRKRVEEIVYQFTDFDVLTRLVLARNYQSMTDAQRGRFTDEFKRHLSVTYGRNVESYKNERVQITGDREEARGDWTVHTKILRGGGSNDIVVDYRLRKNGEQWLLIDMIIENVSLVSNFRSQFQEVLSGSGPDELIRLLHEKNEKGESFKNDDSKS